MVAKERSQLSRLIALVIGVALLVGGISGVSSEDGLIASKVGAWLSIVAGVGFMSLAARAGRR